MHIALRGCTCAAAAGCAVSAESHFAQYLQHPAKGVCICQLGGPCGIYIAVCTHAPPARGDARGLAPVELVDLHYRI